MSDQQRPDQIRVLLADDHEVFRLGIRRFFDDYGEIAIVAEAGSGQEAVTRTREQRPEVVIMDLLMPEKDGIQATREIKAELPDTQVVMLTAVADDDQVVAALQAGARAYLVKGEDPESLLPAIRNVMTGHLYLDPRLARRVLRRLVDAPALQHADGRPSKRELTARETSILKLMAQGKRAREIGSALQISERTVRNHLRSVFSKLRVQNRAHAIIYAVKSGIIQP